MITLYVRQQNRHRCIEQSFGLCGGEQRWDDLGEWHWNMYIILREMDRQSRFNAKTGCLGLVHWDDPEGWYTEGVGGGFRMENTCTPMADSCQCMAKPLQYCKVICLQLKWLNLFLKNQMRLMDYILNFNIELFYKIYPQVLNLAQFCHYNPQINYEMSREK